jgi:hypothetical protein
MIQNLVCLLEEPSAKEMLEGILPQFIDKSITVKYIVFEGKQDLEKNIEKRLKFWQQPNSGFLVMRDKDSGDCIAIKNNLIDKINKTGQIKNSVIRIACHELESFYLGDLSAVEKGLKIKGLAKHQNKSKFREPDKLSNPSEELKKLTKNKYQKVAGSRAIAPHLKLDGSNKSYSFNMLLQGIKKLIEYKTTQ